MAAVREHPLQRLCGGRGIGEVDGHEFVHRVFRLDAVEDHDADSRRRGAALPSPARSRERRR